MAQKLSSDKNILSLDHSCLIVAAIDFGTTFSGYAFSFQSDKTMIYMNKNWGAELSCDSYKAPTCVMTNPDGSFHSFGYKAEHNYSQLDPDEDEIGGPTGYNLYRHFKMMLHDQGVDLNSKVVSTTEHIDKAINIFTMVIKHLHDHMMESIRKALTRPPVASEVQWVLTVPAIWTDESKDFMREAAYRAKLISEKNSRKLLIALEPEAASIFCRSLEINTFESGEEGLTEDLKFKSGQKMLIIDAGGGTVDITAHEILFDGKVKEIAPPSGGPWGGIKVDAEFVSLLSTIVGNDFLNMFKKEQSQQWLQFMTNFEKSKRVFVADGKCSLKVTPSYCFEEELKTYRNKGLKELVNQLQDPNVSFSNGFLIFKHEKARSLFLEPISRITNHVRSLMDDKKVVNLNYILLVGGFGECKMLQEACKQEFGRSVKLLIPLEAQLAVIKGAVLFGHNPLQILSRIARFTYGRGVLYTFDASKHDVARKKTYKGKDWCDDCFEVYITKGEEIQCDEVRHFTTVPVEEGQTSIGFTFYRTEKEKLMYVDEPGVTRIGKATLKSVKGPLSDNIETRVTFGHTEILVEARDADKDDDFPMKAMLNFV